MCYFLFTNATLILQSSEQSDEGPKDTQYLFVIAALPKTLVILRGLCNFRSYMTVLPEMCVKYVK